MIDERPSCGSCPVCHGPLDLTAIASRGVWYCSTACADGRSQRDAPPLLVPEPRLYARPRRFFGSRRPKELHTPSGSD